ncbi:hypothetical protein H5410_015369 [Solanum commersonii]|uniref:Uncharacterized protein n=1 Tax=Solanum commersonii TaxID=4109 RepID=A0A9J5ZTK1_SOLCO|nr:hypothetical protein H5410_015369 [Solanum commersonii]
MMEKVSKARLRWFGHLKKRCTNAPMRRYEKLDIVGKRRGRGRGRPKKYWKEDIRKDMEKSISMHFDFVSRDPPQVGFESRVMGDYPAQFGEQMCYCVI